MTRSRRTANPNGALFVERQEGQEVKELFSVQRLKRLTAAAVFIVTGIVTINAVPTLEIAWVSVILLLTIYLFAFEIVGVDVAAITIMDLLGLTTLLAP